jgi:hypothetical protein
MLYYTTARQAPPKKITGYVSFCLSLAWSLGGIECDGKGSISREILAKVVSYHGKLGLGDRFRYRVRNISEGIAMGSYDFIARIQEKFQRKFIRPRSFLSGSVLYSTRVLRQ